MMEFDWEASDLTLSSVHAALSAPDPFSTSSLSSASAVVAFPQAKAHPTLATAATSTGLSHPPINTKVTPDTIAASSVLSGSALGIYNLQPMAAVVAGSNSSNSSDRDDSPKSDKTNRTVTPPPRLRSARPDVRGPIVDLTRGVDCAPRDVIGGLHTPLTDGLRTPADLSSDWNTDIDNTVGSFHGMDWVNRLISETSNFDAMDSFDGAFNFHPSELGPEGDGILTPAFAKSPDTPFSSLDGLKDVSPLTDHFSSAPLAGGIDGLVLSGSHATAKPTDGLAGPGDNRPVEGYQSTLADALASFVSDGNVDSGPRPSHHPRAASDGAIMENARPRAISLSQKPMDAMSVTSLTSKTEGPRKYPPTPAESSLANALKLVSSSGLRKPPSDPTLWSTASRTISPQDLWRVSPIQLPHRVPGVASKPADPQATPQASNTPQSTAPGHITGQSSAAPQTTTQPSASPQTAAKASTGSKTEAATQVPTASSPKAGAATIAAKRRVEAPRPIDTKAANERMEGLRKLQQQCQTFSQSHPQGANASTQAQQPSSQAQHSEAATTLGPAFPDPAPVSAPGPVQRHFIPHQVVPHPSGLGFVSVPVTVAPDGQPQTAPMQMQQGHLMSSSGPMSYSQVHALATRQAQVHTHAQQMQFGTVPFRQQNHMMGTANASMANMMHSVSVPVSPLVHYPPAFPHNMPFFYPSSAGGSTLSTSSSCESVNTPGGFDAGMGAHMRQVSPSRINPARSTPNMRSSTPTRPKPPVKAMTPSSYSHPTFAATPFSPASYAGQQGGGEYLGFVPSTPFSFSDGFTACSASPQAPQSFNFNSTPTRAAPTAPASPAFSDGESYDEMDETGLRWKHYTPADAEEICAAVAPSGSSKRKRGDEVKRRVRRFPGKGKGKAGGGGGRDDDDDDGSSVEDGSSEDDLGGRLTSVSGRKVAGKAKAKAKSSKARSKATGAARPRSKAN